MSRRFRFVCWPGWAILLVSSCTSWGNIGDMLLSGDAGPLFVVGDSDSNPIGDENLPGDANAPDPGDPNLLPSAQFSFVVVGDTQFGSNCTSGVSERLAVPQAVLDLAPDFVLHTGDLMDKGGTTGAYDRFQGCWDDLLAAVPFFPTSGNHDHGYDGIANYKNYLEDQLFSVNPAIYGATYDQDFPLTYEDDTTSYSHDFSHPSHLDDVPSGVSFETFYAFRHGNAYFISFEQGTRYWTNTPKSWVERHLSLAQADPTIEHIFVYLHHPIYSTTMKESSDSECVLPVRKAYESLFKQYGVTMVFSGHAHLYDHLYVPDDGTPTTDWSGSSYPEGPDSIHYVVTGGGGGPLNGCKSYTEDKVGESFDYPQDRVCDYHVTQVEVDGARLTVRIVVVDGSESSHTTSVFDEFTIE